MESYSSHYKVNNLEADQKFVKWIDEVEKLVFNTIHQYLLDLEDELYMDNYENGLTPKQMASIVIAHYHNFYNDYLDI